MKNLFMAVCKQQWPRSACTAVQSDNYSSKPFNEVGWFVCQGSNLEMLVVFSKKQVEIAITCYI